MNRYLSHKYDQNSRVTLSVIVTFHNHDKIVEKVLTGINKSISTIYEIIIINDASKDNTDLAITNFLHKFKFPNKLVEIRYINLRFSKFETKCDNLGCKYAKGKYLLFLQGDMVLKDFNLERRLISILESKKNIGAISGHSVDSDLTGKKKVQWKIARGSGFKLRELRKFSYKNFEAKQFNKKNVFVEKFDNLDKLILSFQQYRKIYYNDTSNGINENIYRHAIVFTGKYINRGPIFIEKKYFMHLGMYKEKIYFQGWDDIDLSLEICKDGKVVGFSPINYISKNEWGVGRQKKSWIMVLNIFYQIIKRKKNHKYSLILNDKLILEDNLFYGKVFLINILN